MHQGYSRELFDKEKRAIRKLTTTTCANYDHEYECLILEGTCYMCTIGFTTSTLCKYFEKAVLPLKPELEAIFKNTTVKPCQRCGKKFLVSGRKAYCSTACADATRKVATASRVRKHRNHPGKT